MGYRLRLGRANKEEANPYRLMSLIATEEMMEEDVGDNFALYRPPFHEQIYEMGKYVNVQNHMENFYKFELEENDFKIINQAGLEAIIEEERKDIAGYYEDLTDEQAIAHSQHKARDWAGHHNIKIYHLEKDKDGPIVASWTKEYAIFNLVHMWHTFDFENDYLIYSGW